jgi:hypothetical protein
MTSFALLGELSKSANRSRGDRQAGNRSELLRRQRAVGATGATGAAVAPLGATPELPYAEVGSAKPSLAGGDGQTDNFATDDVAPTDINVVADDPPPIMQPQGPSDAWLANAMGSYNPNSPFDQGKAEAARQAWVRNNGNLTPNQLYADAGYIQASRRA